MQILIKKNKPFLKNISLASMILIPFGLYLAANAHLSFLMYLLLGLMALNMVLAIIVG